MAKNNTPLEEYEQEQIFRWARANQTKYPDLQLLNASMAGVRLRPGQRIKAKKQGMPKGYPDIFLPVSVDAYSGLFIELKRLRGGVVFQDQKTWLKWLNAEGFKAVVARGHEEAIWIIRQYLRIS